MVSTTAARAESSDRYDAKISTGPDIFLPESTRQNNSILVAQPGSNSYSTPHDSVFKKAQGDLTGIGRKATTRDFWISVMQIGGISLISAIADKPMDRYAANHGTSGIMPTIKNIGNVLPLAAIGYSSVMFLTSDDNSLIGQTSYDALAAGGLGLAGALGLKYAVGRARPSVEKGSASFTPMNAGNGDTSWPSIHTTVMWSMITPYAKAYDAPWLYGVAAVTNVARVAGRDHWLSDTVAGALFGYAIGDYMWSSHQLQEHTAEWAISPSKISVSWRM